jgi:hypothetical protein
MIPIPNTNLWLGNASDLRDVPQLLKHGLTAIVDLAVEEPVPALPRTTNYCRFVVTDDGENDPATLWAAIQTAAAFLAGGHLTAICCNAGLNRSPCIAAAALACNSRGTPAHFLELIAQSKPVDVNPSLWNQIVGVVSAFATKAI